MWEAQAGAPQLLSPGRRPAGPLRPGAAQLWARAIRRPRAGRGCSQHRLKGPGRGGWRQARARDGGPERRPGLNGP